MKIHLRERASDYIRIGEVVARYLILEVRAHLQLQLVWLLVRRGRSVLDIRAVLGGQEPFHGGAGGCQFNEGDLLS